MIQGRVRNTEHRNPPYPRHTSSNWLWPWPSLTFSPFSPLSSDADLPGSSPSRARRPMSPSIRAFRLSSAARHAGGAEELVHLLQGAALGLGHQEEDVEDGDGGDAAEEDEGAICGRRDERRSGHAHGEVVELFLQQHGVSISGPGGVKREKWKESRSDRHTQLLLPPTLTPLARMESGNTSDVTIQATGPTRKV